MSNSALHVTPETPSSSTLAAFSPYPWCLSLLTNPAHTPVQTIHQIPTASNPWGLSVLLQRPDAIQASQSLLVQQDRGGEQIQTLYALGYGVSGPRGLLHGGLAATMLGQQGYALAAADPDMVGAISVRIDVEYLRSVLIPGAVRVRVWKTGGGKGGRKWRVVTVMEDGEEQALVRAEMVYVVPRGRL